MPVKLKNKMYYLPFINAQCPFTTFFLFYSLPNAMVFWVVARVQLVRGSV